MCDWTRLRLSLGYHINNEPRTQQMHCYGYQTKPTLYYVVLSCLNLPALCAMTFSRKCTLQSVDTVSGEYMVNTQTDNSNGITTESVMY